MKKILILVLFFLISQNFGITENKFLNSINKGLQTTFTYLDTPDGQRTLGSFVGGTYIDKNGDIVYESENLYNRAKAIKGGYYEEYIQNGVFKNDNKKI